MSDWKYLPLAYIVVRPYAYYIFRLLITLICIRFVGVILALMDALWKVNDERL